MTLSTLPTEMNGRSLVSASVDSAGVSPLSFHGPLPDRSDESVTMSSSVGALNFTSPVKSFDRSNAGGTAVGGVLGSTCLLVVKRTPPPRRGPIFADPNQPGEQFALLLLFPHLPSQCMCDLPAT